MRKKIVIGLFLTSFFLLFPFKVLAVAGNTTGTMGIEGREGVEAVKQNLIATRSAVRQETREQIQEMRQNLIRQRQEIRAQFLEKLNAIRDTRKKQIVANLEKRMNEINQNRTEQMLKHLDKMAEILTRIKNLELVIKNEVDKKNLDSLIATAETAIATAKAAVEAQAGRTYTPAVTNETTLRLVTGQSLAALQADLKATREKILLAKRAVMDAWLALVKLRGSVTPVATESGR